VQREPIVAFVWQHWKLFIVKSFMYNESNKR